MNFIPFWDLPLRWEHCIPFLRKALARQTAWDERGLYRELSESRMHLWEMPGCGAVVTQIQTFPLERICVIVLCGGENIKDWFADAYATVIRYAKAHGCKAVVIIGRPGWGRLLDSMETKAIVMRNEL